MNLFNGRLLFFVVSSLLLSLTVAMGSMWQIEEIWRSLQNGWPYGLPFGNYTTNYWFAHDIWFVAWAISYVVPVGLTIWLTARLVSQSE